MRLAVALRQLKAMPEREVELNVLDLVPRLEPCEDLLPQSFVDYVERFLFDAVEGDTAQRKADQTYLQEVRGSDVLEEPQGEARFFKVENVVPIQNLGSFLLDLFTGRENRGIVVRVLHCCFDSLQAAGVIVRCDPPVRDKDLPKYFLAQVRTEVKEPEGYSAMTLRMLRFIF